MREENQLNYIALHKRLEKTNKQIAQLTKRRDSIAPGQSREKDWERDEHDMNLHIARNNADSQKRQIEHHEKWGMAHVYGPDNVHEGEHAITDARRYTVTAIHHERFTGRDDNGDTAKIPYTQILYTYPGPAKTRPNAGSEKK